MGRRGKKKDAEKEGRGGGGETMGRREKKTVKEVRNSIREWSKDVTDKNLTLPKSRCFSNSHPHAHNV